MDNIFFHTQNVLATIQKNNGARKYDLLDDMYDEEDFQQFVKKQVEDGMPEDINADHWKVYFDYYILKKPISPFQEPDIYRKLHSLLEDAMKLVEWSTEKNSTNVNLPIIGTANIPELSGRLGGGEKCFEVILFSENIFKVAEIIGSIYSNSLPVSVWEGKVNWDNDIVYSSLSTEVRDDFVRNFLTYYMLRDFTEDCTSVNTDNFSQCVINAIEYFVVANEFFHYYMRHDVKSKEDNDADNHAKEFQKQQFFKQCIDSDRIAVSATLALCGKKYNNYIASYLGILIAFSITEMIQTFDGFYRRNIKSYFLPHPPIKDRIETLTSAYKDLCKTECDFLVDLFLSVERVFLFESMEVLALVYIVAKSIEDFNITKVSIEELNQLIDVSMTSWKQKNRRIIYASKILGETLYDDIEEQKRSNTVLRLESMQRKNGAKLYMHPRVEEIEEQIDELIEVYLPQHNINGFSRENLVAFFKEQMKYTPPSKYQNPFTYHDIYETMLEVFEVEKQISENKARIRFPLIGTIPLRQFSAYIQGSETTLPLIIVSDALLDFTDSISDIISSALPLSTWSNKMEIDDDYIASSIPIQVKNGFAELFITYFYTQEAITSFSSLDYVTDENSRTMSLIIKKGFLRFVIAHEVMHYSLGHLFTQKADKKNKETAIDNENYEQEYMADAYAANNIKVYLKPYEEIFPAATYLGPILVLSSLSLFKFFEDNIIFFNSEGTNEHPHPSDRIAQLNTLFNQGYKIDVCYYYDLLMSMENALLTHTLNIMSLLNAECTNREIDIHSLSGRDMSEMLKNVFIENEDDEQNIPGGGTISISMDVEDFKNSYGAALIQMIEDELEDEIDEDLDSAELMMQKTEKTERLRNLHAMLENYKEMISEMDETQLTTDNESATSSKGAKNQKKGIFSKIKSIFVK